MNIPDKLGKFNIINFLGRGNFGCVYQGFDTLLNAERAIKLIKVPKPEKYLEAVNEAQTLEICRHKHIVDVKEVDVIYHKGIPYVYIAMEYLAKGSIQKHLETKFISIQEAFKIISEALLGLEHSHNSNVLHRDIKPGNILLGDNGEAKLSDFGLALEYHVDPSDTSGYRPHQPLEVINGNAMNKLSDIYAMGITLFRLLNNELNVDFPFNTTYEWKKAVQRNKYPERNYRPHIPRKIKTIVNKSLNNDVNKRYQSASQFRQAIDNVNLSVDWHPRNENHWLGSGLNGDQFELVRDKKRTGWLIEFKKNNRRIQNTCYSKLSEIDSQNILFEIIQKI
jgi:serine/threonine protein kinase